MSEHLAGDLRRAPCSSSTTTSSTSLLACLKPNVSNFQVLVKETGDDLVFLHRVSEGGASRSYGIEAARLARVPTPFVKRARPVLDKLQARSLEYGD